MVIKKKRERPPINKARNERKEQLISKRYKKNYDTSMKLYANKLDNLEEMY